MQDKLSNKLLRAPLLFAAFLFALCAAPGVYGEIATDDVWGYSLDLPAGYKIAEQDGEGLSVLFTHDNIPVTVISKVYKEVRSAESALQEAMQKLPNCRFNISTVPYRRDKASLSRFNMTLDGDNEGWALAAPLAKAVVVVMAYTKASGTHIPPPKEPQGTGEKASSVWQQVIISVLNSFATDRGSKREAGIMTRFAYPTVGNKKISLNIGGKKIDTAIDSSDIEASNFVVGTEYAVLTLYAKSPLYQEAWKRYYRAIFRDSQGRLKGAADDIYRAIRSDALNNAPKSGTAGGSEGYNLSSMLLSWAQNMPYSRGQNAADFTSLPAALAGEGCDCDTRSLLLCTLLDCMGIRCAIFVSPVYSHAIFGAEVSAIKEEQSARLQIEGTYYLLGETTARGVPLGMVAAEHSDAAKWMGVPLGD